jgi:hypothetical protein
MNDKIRIILMRAFLESTGVQIPNQEFCFNPSIPKGQNTRINSNRMIGFLKSPRKQLIRWRGTSQDQQGFVSAH